MNEAGLNAKWLRKDLTHPETQAFAKDVLNHMRQRLSDYQEQYGDLYNLEATPAESTAYRLAKHDKMLYPGYHHGRMKTARRITRTPAICRSDTRRISSLRSMYRMNCRRSIPPARYSMPSSEKSCRTGRRRQASFGKSRKITACRITRCRRPIPSAKTTAILQESSRSAPSAEKKPRSTAASPAITAPCRTGTTARRRNSRIAGRTTSARRS